VANHFPTVAQLQVSSLQYTIMVGGISGPSATFPAGKLDLLNTSFVTLQDDGTLLFDYSQFDQDAHETQMKGLLNNLCAVMAGNVGVPVPAAQAAMSVTRKWLFTSPSQVGAAYPAFELDDQMPYP
jgi:hypothetical protein